MDGALEGTPDQLVLRATDLRGGGGIREDADEVAHFAVVAALRATGAGCRSASARRCRAAAPRSRAGRRPRARAAVTSRSSTTRPCVRPADSLWIGEMRISSLRPSSRVAGERRRRARSAAPRRARGCGGQRVLDAIADHRLARSAASSRARRRWHSRRGRSRRRRARRLPSVRRPRGRRRARVGRAGRARSPTRRSSPVTAKANGVGPKRPIGRSRPS